MHLLSAVREEVTELRQQIRTLNEKINSIEHENTFLRQHVPSEIYAQYIPTFIGESLNPTTSVIPSISSSQTMPMTSLSSLPSAIAQQASISTNNSQPVSSITATT
jgi:TolA-binding protein